ncbi:DUF1963 domain-containing protein [Plastoroseomonas arctica]|uniref:DUF1963 domain-containing protein n=1 Tax=Plastoroseomonas arctica TaxID=1509237 RepID=A0AAF1K8H6_9PROT|nr:DUF1963 domain-containing protein [Plastoroseomonas arctica]MBR0657441.1 DUF1963 domain-containing protein [Plastoroseomonas arctica]
MLPKTRGGAFVLRRVFPPSEGLGTSFLGGKPRLPLDVAWPTTKDGKGLSFLGQIDLDALPKTRARNRLPSGALLFFVYTADLFSRCDQPGHSAVLHVTGGLASIPPREPPEHVPSVYGNSANFYLPWVPPDSAWLPPTKGVPAPQGPRSFPSWNVEGSSLRTVVDARDGREITGKDGVRHRNSADAAIWRAYEGVFGPAPLWEYPTWWEEKDLPRLGDHPLPLAQREVAWVPDDTWPYAWINIQIFAASFMKQLEFKEISEFKGRTSDSERFLTEAASWHLEGTQAGPFTGVTADRRAAFRAWSDAIGPAFPSFRLRQLNELTGKAFVAGADAMLGYAPEAARSLLPARLLPVLAGRHAPFARRKRKDPLLVRHQLLGHGRSVQGAPERLGEDHLLLGQFDTDDGMFWMWGDVGVLQFWITPANLAAGNFATCIMTLESQ